MSSQLAFKFIQPALSSVFMLLYFNMNEYLFYVKLRRAIQIYHYLLKERYFNVTIMEDMTNLEHFHLKEK